MNEEMNPRKYAKHRNKTNISKFEKSYDYKDIIFLFLVRLIFSIETRINRLMTNTKYTISTR